MSIQIYHNEILNIGMCIHNSATSVKCAMASGNIILFNVR